jgi:hypothetical protein
MKVMAFKRIAVLLQNGLADSKSYIAPSDLCEVGEKTASGLWPVTYPTSKGKKTRWVRTLKGFLCNQNEYAGLSYPAPGYETATIKSGGCGVCASVNAVAALTGKNVPVRAMRDLAVDGQARVSGGTDMRQMITLLCRDFGLKSRTTSSVYEMQQHLAQGGVAICNTAGKGMFSTGGHYVVALGMLGNKICIADPGLYTGKYSNAKRRAAVTVSGDLIFASAATLDADCVGRWPRYYLLSKGG